MSGSSTDYIVIPIVAILTLAFWLIMVYYSGSHPQWRRPTADQARGTITTLPSRPDISGGRQSQSSVTVSPRDRSPR